MSGIDRAIAYRNMRANQERLRLAREARGEDTTPRTRWERWQAFLNRLADRLL